jgi:hypothetical protein
VDQTLAKHAIDLKQTVLATGVPQVIDVHEIAHKAVEVLGPEVR